MDQRSRSKGTWAAALGNLLDEGWRIAFTDGTGPNTAAGVSSLDRRGGHPQRYGSHLGPKATVHGAELLAIDLALRTEVYFPLFPMYPSSQRC